MLDSGWDLAAKPSGSPVAGVSLARLEGVAVTVQRTPVLRGLDLDIGSGEVLGVLGANGSGKTTLLQLLATLISPAAGTGHVLGAALGSSGSAAVRPLVALVGHQPALYPQLTLAENLCFVARLTGHDAEAADGALAAVGLAGAGHRRADRCSQGMLRRADLARVLITRPRLLLLDEVHAGLDRDSIGLVDEVIRRVRERAGSAVLVSHDAGRLSGLADRLVRIVDGRALPMTPTRLGQEP